MAGAKATGAKATKAAKEDGLHGSRCASDRREDWRELGGGIGRTETKRVLVTSSDAPLAPSRKKLLRSYFQRPIAPFVAARS